MTSLILENIYNYDIAFSQVLDSIFSFLNVKKGIKLFLQRGDFFSFLFSSCINVANFKHKSNKRVRYAFKSLFIIIIIFILQAGMLKLWHFRAELMKGSHLDKFETCQSLGKIIWIWKIRFFSNEIFISILKKISRLMAIWRLCTRKSSRSICISFLAEITLVRECYLTTPWDLEKINPPNALLNVKLSVYNIQVGCVYNPLGSKIGNRQIQSFRTLVQLSVIVFQDFFSTCQISQFPLWISPTFRKVSWIFSP